MKKSHRSLLGSGYFVKKVAGFAIAQGHRPVQWAEVYTAFGNSLPKEVIVHTWATENYGDGQNDQVIKPLQGGYNVLLSPQMRDPKPCAKDLPTGWYLDNVRTTPLKNERWPSTRLTPANILYACAR